MTFISQTVLAEAIVVVNQMDIAERLLLADEIFAQQPNLLASVLVLQRMGLSLQQLDIPIYILLVAYQSMKASGHYWPVISEDIQESCLQRLTGKIHFTEGLSPPLFQQAVDQQINEHGERYLLSFVYGYLGENDLLAIKTEAEKYLLLALLNLVDCIAITASHALATQAEKQ